MGVFFTTTSWQVHLWEAGGPVTAAVRDEEAYAAALALIASGVLTRAPRLLRSAEALLKRLDAREGRCAVCPRCHERKSRAAVLSPQGPRLQPSP